VRQCNSFFFLRFMARLTVIHAGYASDSLLIIKS
jgi:hypothetical protein